MVADSDVVSGELQSVESDGGVEAALRLQQLAQLTGGAFGALSVVDHRSLSEGAEVAAHNRLVLGVGNAVDGHAHT